MLASDHVITETLYSSVHTTVYRAYKRDDLRQVILRLPRDPNSAVDLARLQQEQEIIKLLRLERLRGEEVPPSKRPDAVVSEYVDGTTLRRLIDRKGLDLATSLRIAEKLTEHIGELHRRHLVHKDINPQNVWVHLEQGQVSLLSYAMCSPLPRETPTAVRAEELAGALAYISPEQTGRINRPLDYRTDFYSLGVTLYELFTGQLPFRKGDPIEMVHAHLAKRPPSPREVAPTVPSALSEIVLKLLAKDAGDRYQSATGILFDLRACSAQLAATGSIGDIPMGAGDRIDNFQIPHRLYGREAEVAALTAAFERAAAGRRELVLIAGYAGIGKSMLANEIQGSVLGARGLFATGKFEQFKRNIPYLAFAIAFRELIRQILAGSAESVARWRQQMLVALGNDGQIIIDVIPEVELIIGPQPRPTPLDPTDAQSRFQTVFENFIGVLATADHPLALFIDDLQWADSSSLKLLRWLVTRSGGLHLLLIGSYRDNELDAAHPLTATLGEIERADAAFTRIMVGPLKENHVRQLVADTMRCTREEADPLARLLIDKTLGNPFFLTQLLLSLYDNGLIRFDMASRCWRWDTEEIRRSEEGTGNVVQLMVSRVQRLPSQTQAVLKLAACMGGQFSLGMVAALAGLSPAQASADLRSAVQEGQIIPLTSEKPTPALPGAAPPPPASITLSSRAERQDATSTIMDSSTWPFSVVFDTQGTLNISYRFVHDRVHQAAHSLLSEDERKSVHHAIGWMMLKQSDGASLEERVFDIVNHLNACLDLINEADQRRKLAELNLIAGKRARASTAYDLALKHFTTALDLLSPESWETDYELTLALHLGRAECEYVVGAFARAEEIFDQILGRVRSNLDKAAVHTLRIAFYRHTIRYDRAVDVGIEGLRLFGVHLPSREDAEGLAALEQAEVRALQELLRGRDIARLLDLPELRDPEKLATVGLLAEIAISGLLASPTLMRISAFKVIDISLREGNSHASCAAYGAYGVFLGQILQDFESGYKFGRLAVELARKYGDAREQCKSGVWHGALISPWWEHLSASIVTLKEARELGLRSGERAYTSYAIFQVAQLASTGGDSVDEAIAEAQSYLHLPDEEARFGTIIYRQASLCMKGATLGPGDFNSEGFDEAAFLEQISGKYALALQHYYITKAKALYLYERPEEALRAVEARIAAGPAEIILYAQFGPTEGTLYHCLILLALMDGATAEERRAREQTVREGLARLSRWSESCPANFQHKELLLRAEMARVEGRETDCLDLYERAIESAQTHRAPQVHALACELAARFHLARGRRGLARSYLAAARAAYAGWGAFGKVRHIEQRYPDLLGAPEPVDGQRQPASLDLATVMSAAQAISGEIVLERLLQRMMRIIIENAGAERGYFMVERDGGLVIEVSATAEDERVVALQSLPAERCPDVSQTIVARVRRTGATIVVDDAQVDPRFSGDPDVAARKRRSILCTRIVTQKSPVGILYLENSLVTGAFTPERIKVLEILSAQAAISLENASLYDTLEHKVEQRTRELQERNEELEHAMRRLTETQHQLVMQEKLASLGALTAGIAHEIKNPLNLINNFAELSVDISRELQDELTAHADRLPPETRENVEALLTDLALNARTINQHGKRADRIVESMLAHSRTGTGKPQWTDLNALVAEYANLTYQGFRSNKPTCDPQLQASYDPSVPPVHIVPPDVGRVIVNLLNNALYAVSAKARERGPGFSPVITLQTRNLEETVEIRIRDNGVGIPATIQESIFSPFFTTKPPGEGTGLGLSISYDIIVQGNNGSIRVESEPGESAEFIVTLPKKQGSPG